MTQPSADKNSGIEQNQWQSYLSSLLNLFEKLQLILFTLSNIS